MSRGARRTVAAAGATALALVVLLPVLHGQDWIVRGLGAVVVVAATGLLSRRLRLPVLLQAVVGLLALVAYLLVVFVPGTFHHGLPSAATVDRVRELVRNGRADLQHYAPPLVPAQGLLLICTAGIGLVALLVDLLAVGLDRVVLSGLPLLALFEVPSAVLPHGIGGPFFVIGASGWLLLLVQEGGDRTLRWGRPMRSVVPGAKAAVDDGSQARVGRRIAAAALGLAVLVPTLVPGLERQLSGGGGGGGSGSGTASAVTYNPITTLQQELTLPEPRQLFVYTTDDPSPDYVRMTTLDLYTGSGWQSSELQADPQQARVQKGLGPGTGEEGTSQDVTMQVAVDGDHLDVHWLPLPYGPRQVSVSGTWLWDPTSQTAFSAARTTRNLPPYTVHASRPVPDRAALESAGADYPASVRHYLIPLAVSPTVEKLALRLAQGQATPYDKAVAIQRYFTDPRNGFVYDLTPSQPVPGQDPLDAFLAGRHGFCQQYATAMAVLLRLAGLPSRVAVGFTSGQQVTGRSDTYRVTTTDAHAWPEAFFPGIGWVRFEPTPEAAGASTPDYTLPPVVGGNGSTTSPQPQASDRPGHSQFKDPGKLFAPAPGDSPQAAKPAARTHRSPWLLGALGLVLLALLPAGATWARRRARAAAHTPEAAWQQLRDDALDAGRDWHDADSPRAAAARLRPGLPPQALPALDRLARCVEVARYAPPGRALDGDVVADGAFVRRALLASAPRVVRWRARVLTPSTLRWAAHGASERVADLLDGVDRVLAWAFRPVRRVLRLS